MYRPFCKRTLALECHGIRKDLQSNRFNAKLPPVKTVLEDLLEDIAKRLSQEFQPEQVWLFGSHAWGNPSKSSDLDLLVIVRESADSPVQRAQKAHRCLRDVDAAIDVIVKTRAEIERFRNVRSSLESLILRNGRLIYGSRKA